MRYLVSMLISSLVLYVFFKTVMNTYFDHTWPTLFRRDTVIKINISKKFPKYKNLLYQKYQRINYRRQKTDVRFGMTAVANCLFIFLLPTPQKIYSDIVSRKKKKKFVGLRRVVNDPPSASGLITNGHYFRMARGYRSSLTNKWPVLIPFLTYKPGNTLGLFLEFNFICQKRNSTPGHHRSQRAHTLMAIIYALHG